MRLDGFGLFVDDMSTMVRFYRDVLGFEIKEGEDAINVYLIKDGTLFMLYERKNFEKMTSRKYEYLKGLNGHFEIALYVDTFEEVDAQYENAIAKGAQHLTADTAAVFAFEFCCQPARHGGCGDPAGLGTADTPLNTSAHRQSDLGELGGFSGTGRAAEDDELMFLPELLDFSGFCADRQVGRVGDGELFCRQLTGFLKGGNGLVHGDPEEF